MDPLATTYTIQIQGRDGTWSNYSQREYDTPLAAMAAAGKVYGGAVPTRVVAITRTVFGERQPIGDAGLPAGARNEER